MVECKSLFVFADQDEDDHCHHSLVLGRDSTLLARLPCFALRLRCRSPRGLGWHRRDRGL